MNSSFFISPIWGQQISQDSGFLVRIADSKDLTQLADILASSFHSREGFVDWVYPVLRLGIYEDLKNRDSLQGLKKSSAHQQPQKALSPSRL